MWSLILFVVICAIIYLVIFGHKNFLNDKEFHLGIDSYGAINYLDGKGMLIAIIYPKGVIDYYVNTHELSLHHLFKIDDIKNNFDKYIKSIKYV